MGANDAAEMLEAAKAECIRLERELAAMSALAEVNAMNVSDYLAAVEDAKQARFELENARMAAAQPRQIDRTALDKRLREIGAIATRDHDGETVEWVNCPLSIVLDHAALSTPVEPRQIDREALIEAIAGRLSWPSLHWDWRTRAAHAAIADAILAHLSPILATGEEDKWRRAAEVILAEVRVQGVPALEFIDRVVTQ